MNYLTQLKRGEALSSFSLIDILIKVPPLLLCVVLGKIGPLYEACDCVNTKKRCPGYMGKVDG